MDEVVGRRDKPTKEKKSVARAEFVAEISNILADIQTGLFERAKAFRAEHTRIINAKDKFFKFFSATSEPGKPTPIHGGFALAHFCGDPELEEQIKKEHGITVRCIPAPGQLEGTDEEGKCIFTGKPAVESILVARAY